MRIKQFGRNIDRHRRRHRRRRPCDLVTGLSGQGAARFQTPRHAEVDFFGSNCRTMIAQAQANGFQYIRA